MGPRGAASLSKCLNNNNETHKEQKDWRYSSKVILTKIDKTPGCQFSSYLENFTVSAKLDYICERRQIYHRDVVMNPCKVLKLPKTNLKGIRRHVLEPYTCSVMFEAWPEVLSCC